MVVVGEVEVSVVETVVVAEMADEEPWVGDAGQAGRGEPEGDFTGEHG